MGKSYYKNFRYHIRLFFFEATMNPALIGVLYLFGKQYIKGRVLSHSVILRSNFLKYLNSLG